MSKSLGNTSTHTNPVSDTQSELGTCTKQEVDIFGVSFRIKNKMHVIYYRKLKYKNILFICSSFQTQV